MRTLVLALSIATALPGQPAKSKQSEVDRIFSAFNTHTPGCAVGVSYQGTVALRSGYGMADLERNVPITADTVFESGSVAKQFTATALVLLAQQGKISLDDPLREYLPELPDYGKALTIRQVLSHISGLREWRLVASLSGIAEGAYVLNNQDLLRIAARQRALNFDPGTAYSYTNTGFNIATILIERALGNGKTFQDFTREAIFEPLRMTHTRWRDDFRVVVPNRALAYDSAGGGWIQDTPIENIIGAGGMLSTVGDWLLWNENFTHAKVGGQALVKALQTPATLSNGKTIAYAFGLTVDTFDGLREVSHGGSTGGYRTWIGRYPDRGVSIAVMCNSAQADPSELGRQTARLWTGAAASPKPAPFRVDPSKFEEMTGMYRKLRDNTVVELKVKDGELTIDQRVQLNPTGAGRFSAGERQFVFEADGFREVTPDGDTVYERVQPAHPSDSELASLAGEYASPETATTLTIAARAGELSLVVASNPPVVLRPTFQDAFMLRDRGATSIRFLRDSSGIVTGLSAGDDRVWDLRFTRVNAGPSPAAAR
ncbi:MAG TPA: serine hydrolase domain-containing protein [Bryobacteraceae bacterium]|nr:serine hydrolase domain-containing protein [Bryobacteraceae bacterium]